MPLPELMRQHQRLAILRLLNEAQGGDLNDSILQDAMAQFGLDISRDALRTELAWLAEQGLVALAEVYHTQVASLTARGADVALGRAQVPGIKRPRPGAGA
ncbi:ArsR family transcriptional regulator [Ferrimonas balearica]|uniref:VpaChn25_0724 family phage protein n=1 Tax=Ferrimonas balearica TaxID=44012 RepID=UPI001C9492BC|nr:ArsR family transcriptional regulator [Ferrimonas balearica]MBY6223576.1 ArsR family transcriptional regulator [Ferrimonas balearica]